MRDIAALIDSLRSSGSTLPSEGLMERVAKVGQLFDLQTSGQDADINIFNFHAEAEDACSVVDMVDVQRDNRLIDYGAMRAHLVWCAKTYCRKARIYLVSDGRASSRAEPAGAVTIEMDVDRSAIMLERVIAMCAYVHSRAFRADTVFLDTDAFPNSDLARVFDSEFDIGVTYRHDPQVMPLNEGVIFASARNVRAVRSFFVDYLSTFERLGTCGRVRNYYGSIGHWRGGQLSLNVLALPNSWPVIENGKLNGVRVAYLPCEEFNYSPDSALEPERVAGLLRSKRIVHIKGQDKRHFLTVRDHALRQSVAATT